MSFDLEEYMKGYEAAKNNLQKPIQNENSFDLDKYMAEYQEPVTQSENQINKNFADNHPIVSSIPEAGKQFGLRAIKSYPEFAKGLNDLTALIGDKTGINSISNFGKNNAEFWENQSNKIQINPEYQGIKGLSKKSTFLPTVLGSVGDQATKVLMAMGGGAGGAKVAGQIGLNGLSKAGLITAGTALPNLAQEGSYLDKIQAFQQIYGRTPTTEELANIQNAAITEKGINTALETLADKLLFAKLFPHSTVSKGIKNVLKNIGEQSLTEGLTEAAQESVSIGAEKYLGINKGNNLQRLADSAGIGAITGGLIGGGVSAISQSDNFNNDTQKTKDINAIKSVSAKIVQNGKELYNSAKETLNQPDTFDNLKALSRGGVLSRNSNISDVAPNTVAKQEAKKENIPPVETNVQKNTKNTNIAKEIAPKTAAKQEAEKQENSEITTPEQIGSHTKDFQKSDIVQDIYTGEVFEIIEADKKGMGKLRNVDDDSIRTLNAHNNAHFKKYLPKESEYIKVQEFKYDKKNRDNSYNYAMSVQDVVDSYNDYINSPTVENKEKYQDAFGQATEKYKTEIEPQYKKSKEENNTNKTGSAINSNIKEIAPNTVEKETIKQHLADIQKIRKALQDKLNKGDFYENFGQSEIRELKNKINIYDISPENRNIIINELDSLTNWASSATLPAGVKIKNKKTRVSKKQKNISYNTTNTKKSFDNSIIDKLKNGTATIDESNEATRYYLKLRNQKETFEESKRLKSLIDNNLKIREAKNNDNEMPYNISEIPNEITRGSNISDKNQGISQKNLENSGEIENNENITTSQEDNLNGRNDIRRSEERTETISERESGRGETNPEYRLDSRTDLSGNEVRNGSGASILSIHNRHLEDYVNKKYKNQHELNQSIEKFINEKEYEKYDKLPEEIKSWLKTYTGSGGLEKQGATGKGLLSEYYTPKNIVQKMWDITSQYIDTDGAKILEPSVGIGRFLENAPQNTSFDVIEMNPITSKITEMLYPEANVKTGQFQEQFIENNKPIKKIDPQYDIVIGNPPYGQYSGLYKGLGEGKVHPRIENYFIDRALDSLKENGILTFIVPSSFLKNATTKSKQQIAKKAELIDAYRLPENTFDTTQIGTDIIVLRKKKGANDNNIIEDNWFKQHPEKILGTVEERKSRFGNKTETYVKGDKNTVDSIDTSKKEFTKSKKTPVQKNKITENSTVKKNLTIKKSTLPKKEEIQEQKTVDYEVYKPKNSATQEEIQLFADTKVDGTLPEDKYSPGKNVNQYKDKLYNDFNYLQGDIYEKLDQLENEDISEV